jgi:predicted metal-binding membrane protein
VGGLSAAQAPTLADRRATRSELGDALAAVRMRLALVALLFALAALAWWSTAERMAGMDAGPGTDLGALGWFMGVWVVMMAAMMFPSVAPTVALYAQMTRRRGLSRPLLFTSGYLFVWGVAGVAAYGLFHLGRGLFGADLGWDDGGRWFAGGVLTIAALYELTPLKDICLTKCRSPLGFLLGTWRDGRRGAVELGARHGAWCLGCCWALMAALFALGVMSLAWTALVAALISFEKTLPWGRAVTWTAAAVLLVFAIALVAAPHSVPGLVVPGTAHGGAHATRHASSSRAETTCVRLRRHASRRLAEASVAAAPPERHFQPSNSSDTARKMAICSASASPV